MLSVQGLSPRGRGNLWLRLRGLWSRGSIPRVGGATETEGGGLANFEGLSPRGRGNRCRSPEAAAVVGSIPAWAGQPSSILAMTGHEWVYPRVGGATAKRMINSLYGTGLSPRGRGNHRQPKRRCQGFGSIPAWAGQPSGRRGCGWPPGVYPRVGGATIVLGLVSKPRVGLSPRGRGNLGVIKPRSAIRGSIPRVGGATGGLMPMGVVSAGLSPRGRGNQLHLPILGDGRRSIPAWAGQPGHILGGGSPSRSIPAWAGQPAT